MRRRRRPTWACSYELSWKTQHGWACHAARWPQRAPGCCTGRPRGCTTWSGGAPWAPLPSQPPCSASMWPRPSVIVQVHVCIQGEADSQCQQASLAQCSQSVAIQHVSDVTGASTALCFCSLMRDNNAAHSPITDLVCMRQRSGS